MFPKQWISTFSVLVAFLVCFCIAFPAHAAGNTYYVSPSGSASNPGTLAAPFRTIQHGVNALSGPGDTLYIRAGTYSEGIVIPATLAGTPSAPITIAGYPGDARPVIDVPPTNVDQVGFWVPWRASRQDYNLILRDFDIEGLHMTNSQLGWACMQLAG